MSLLQYQVIAEPVFPSSEPRWYEPWSTPVRNKTLAVALIATCINYTPAPPFPETVTESRWHQPWSEPVRVNKIKTALIAASGETVLLGAVSAEVIYEDKWHFAWSEPIVKSKIGLAPNKQQFSAFYPLPFVSFSWFNNLNEPVRLKPGLGSRYQQFETQDAYLPPNPALSLSGWFNWLTEPVRLKPGLKAHLQRTETQDPTYIPNPANFLSGWFNWYSEPVRQKPGLAVYLQRAATQDSNYPPNPFVSLTGWYNWLTEPVRLKPRLTTGNQQFLAYSYTKPIVTFSFYNWYSEPVRQKQGLRYDLQRPFTEDTVLPPVPSSILEGWFNWFAEPVRVKLGLYAFNQRAYTGPDRLLPTPDVTATMDAAESPDTAAMVVNVVRYNPASSARVAIVEIPDGGGSFTSIIES